MNNVFPGVPFIESPLFPTLKTSLELTQKEAEIVTNLHELGYAVLDFPDSEIDARIDLIKHDLGQRYGINFEDPQSDKTLGERRIQDAWKFNDDVRAIAANEGVLNLLSKLYGRRAFPFQTLNFQSAHNRTLT